MVKPATPQKITCMSTWTVILGELVEQFRVWCLLASCQFKQEVPQEQDILKLQLADLHTEIKGKTGLPKSRPQTSLKLAQYGNLETKQDWRSQLPSVSWRRQAGDTTQPQEGDTLHDLAQRKTDTEKLPRRAGTGQFLQESMCVRASVLFATLWTVARAAKWTATGTPTAAKAGSLHAAAWQKLTIAVDQWGMCTPRSSLCQRGLISMLLSNSTTAHGGGEQRVESSW